jgi:hypothetical protein
VSAWAECLSAAHTPVICPQEVLEYLADFSKEREECLERKAAGKKVLTISYCARVGSHSRSFGAV